MKCGLIPDEYKSLYRSLVKKGLAPFHRVQGTVNALERKAPVNVAQSLLRYKEAIDRTNARIRFTQAQLEHPDTMEEGEKNATDSYRRGLQDYVQTRLDLEGKLPDIREAHEEHPDWSDAKFYHIPTRWTDPETPMERLDAAEQMLTDAARVRLLREGQENGEIGGTGPGSSFVNATHPYKALSLYPGHQFGVHPSVKPFYDQILSAHEIAPGALQHQMRSLISMIMWNPAFHSLNIGGRVALQVFSAKGMGKLKNQFQAALRDQASPQIMAERAKDGFVPYFPHGFEPNDWMDRILANMEKRGTVPLPGLAQFLSRWPRMLSRVVNTLGLLYYHMQYDTGIRDGLTHEESALKAGHSATDMAGTMSRDMFTEGAQKWGDFLLFSMRYTSTTLNLGLKALRDDNGLRKKLEMRGVPADRIARVLDLNKQSYRTALMKDYIGNFLVLNGLNYLTTAAFGLEDKNGKKGGHFIWDNPGVTWSDSVMPKRFMLNDAEGKGTYVQTPFRTTRDLLELLDLATSPLDTGRIAANKSSPLVHMVLDLYNASKGDLTMPSPGLTAANVGGKLLSDVSPVDMQSLLVRAADAMYGKSLSPLFEGIYGAVAPRKLSELGLYLSGMQVTGGPPTQDRAVAYQAWRAKQNLMNWLKSPVIRELIQHNDSATLRMMYEESRKSGLSPSMTHQILNYIQHAPPRTKSAMRYKSANP